MDNSSSQGENGELVELHLSCRGLTNLNNLYLSDPQIYVYTNDGKDSKPILVGQTEPIKHNLNPDFHQKIRFTYHFNKIQNILIYVYDQNASVVGILSEMISNGEKKDGFMGSCKTTLSKLMGAKDCVSKLGLLRHETYEGCAMVFIDKVRDNADQTTQISWQFGGRKIKDMDWFSKSDPFAKFYRIDTKENRILVHQTEVIDNDLNPTWKAWQTTADELCPKNDLFYVEVYDYNRVGGHSFIGSCEVSLSSIINQDHHEFKLFTKHHKDGTLLFSIQAGTLLIKNKTIHKPQIIQKKITFLDYLKGGWQLSLVAGIDFTYSNGPINKPDSLHEIKSRDQLNYYQQTLKSLGGIIISYDFDKLVPIYGFGGIPKLPTYTKKYVDDCFPLNGNEKNPCCKDVGGILQAYQDAVPQIELSGPTFVSNMLKNAKLQAKSNAENDIYTVCLIMTDGQIEDMDDAMQILAECSQLPMSIIIVGVGDENFSLMHKLDNVEEIRKHAKPDIKSLVRDIVQFVSYKEFHYSCEKLCASVLDNFPKQFMEYMNINNIQPVVKDQIHLSQYDHSKLN